MVKDNWRTWTYDWGEDPPRSTPRAILNALDVGCLPSAERSRSATITGKELKGKKLSTCRSPARMLVRDSSALVIISYRTFDSVTSAISRGTLSTMLMCRVGTWTVSTPVGGSARSSASSAPSEVARSMRSFDRLPLFRTLKRTILDAPRTIRLAKIVGILASRTGERPPVDGPERLGFGSFTVFPICSRRINLSYRPLENPRSFSTFASGLLLPPLEALRSLLVGEALLLGSSLPAVLLGKERMLPDPASGSMLALSIREELFAGFKSGGCPALLAAALCCIGLSQPKATVSFAFRQCCTFPPS
mmetsp:Transcript_5358/g.21219  ORF Transcript_5358/g.21219 Transcript_5358/m.21219 type:complete len:305 (-) Transcript_5358:1049-1963(-)|eukprot:scaffold1355_cov268-Pinguiococcus_pyrenoidosus.AAC.44